MALRRALVDQTDTHKTGETLLMTDFPPPPPPPPPGGFQQYGYGYATAQPARFGGFWARFGAVFIDALIIGIPFQILSASINAPAALFITQVIVTLVYVAALEGGPTGQTVGRKAVSLRVVDSESLQPGIGPARAVGRYFAKILSSIPLLLGYFWMLWDPRKQTWHDKLARTVVVKA